MRWHRRALVKLTAMLGVTCAVLGGANAAAQENWPNRPITIVVGFQAGASTDTLARLIADKLSSSLGQSVIVENRAGASGMLAMRHVADQPGDGYTFLFGPNTIVISPHLLPNSEGLLDRLTGVAQVSKATLVVATSPNALPVKSISELTELVKNKPGVSYGTAGIGTPQHIAGELYQRAADIDLTHIAYRGTAPAITDLIGGHVDLVFSSLNAVMPFLESGRVLPLAVLDVARSPVLPDVPSMKELGYEGVEISGWQGLLAPAGTPAEIIERVNKEINIIMQHPEIQEALTTQGERPLQSNPEEFTALLKAEYETYGRLIDEFQITPE